MSVIINAKGTSVPYFKIGKTGTTLYQGSSDPSLTYTPAVGDLFIDTDEKSIKFWNGTSWEYTTFGNTTINTAGIESVNDLQVNAGNGFNVIIDGLIWPNTDGTSNQSLRTDGNGNLYWGSPSLGTVTSVAASGGTTGLEFAGSPITDSGTLTLEGVLSTSNGGTGLTVIGGQFDVLGVNSDETGLEYKTLYAGTGINIDISGFAIEISSTAVTSVSLNDNSTEPLYSVTGSPITSSGTINLVLNSHSSNQAFMSPLSGVGQPSFRSIDYADLPFGLYKDNPQTAQSGVVTGENSSITGVGAGSILPGQKSYANGSFAFAGDAQHSIYVLRNQTTTSTPTELFLDGTSARLDIPAFSVVSFDIVVSARRTDASGEGACYKFTGAAIKNATDATISMINTPSKTVVAETNTAWDADVTADTSTGAIKITVTGENSKTIRWVATVTTTEVLS